ncbi:hypothetical protein BC629DRAFT_1575997 [Irpex lacteus]|nr:hypothetical protein BC629DRAFT_1575997 [Irpex lacteus]
MLMGLDGPPTWKMKKLTIDEFEKCFGECVGKARYNDLYVTGKTVNVRYSADGEFKVSGSYGTYERRFAAME